MKSLLIFLTTLILTSTIYSQAIDSFILAKNTIEQYHTILVELYKLKPLSDSKAEIKAHDILCSIPNELFPFPKLYKSNDCNSSSINNIYKFASDCSNVEFSIPITDYLVNQFLKSKINIIPEIRNACIIRTKPAVIIIKYESKGEIVNKYCANKWINRIAIINFIKGDAFIAALRFPSKEENSLPCIQDKITPENNELIVITDLEDKLNSLKSKISNYESEIRILNNELIIKGDSLSKSIKKISTLNSLINTKNDSLTILSELLTKEILRNNVLLNDYLQLQTSYSNYQSTVKTELLSLEKSLKNINSDIDAFGTKVVNTVKSYEKYDIANTSFLAFNYGLVQAPYNPDPNTSTIADPVKYSFHNEDFSRNFGIGYFRPNIGYYISNLKLNFNNAPSPIYSTFDFDKAKEELFKEGIPFNDLHYIKSGHNISTLNIGISFYLVEIFNIKSSKKISSRDSIVHYLNPNRTPQIPILNSLYLMLGTSFVKGQIWNYYDGYFPGNFYKDVNTEYYALDLSSINKTGVTCGITYLKPYFQFEIGYNTLYSDFYINIGANIPIARNNKILRSKTNSPTPHEERNIQRIREDIYKLDEYINTVMKKLNSIQKN